MAENTKIEWAHHTFNPWIGCQKVGPGCDHCYAEAWDARFDGARWGPHAPRTRTTETNWNKVRRWNRKAGEAGMRERVFVASLADVCDTHSSIKEEWRADLAQLLLDCGNLDFLFLTKRAGNIAPVLGRMFPDGVPANLWMGITVVNQEEANRDIVKLLAAKADLRISVAFLSIEPMLGGIDLTQVRTRDDQGTELMLDVLSGEAWVEDSDSAAAYSNRDDGAPFINWVICGGESGSDARPMQIAWARALRDQCEKTATAFLFKQWGEWFPFGEIDAQGLQNTVSKGKEPGSWHEWDEGGFSVRLGKASAGRFLDGRTWDGVPAAM